MRILWTTNIAMPAVDRRAGRKTQGSGHWMHVLLEALRRRSGVQLGVLTALPGLADMDFEEEGVRYFVVGQPPLTSHLAARPVDLERCRDVVRGFVPDVLHVHGSERFFGLLPARGLTPVPAVVSLQGVLSAYIPSFFGALGVRDRLRALAISEVLTRRGLAWDYAGYVRAAAREEEILRGATAFLGRTSWDLALVRQFNPRARYFHVGELLRPEFAAATWSLDACTRGHLFVTNVGHPRRGTESILEAVAILRARGHDVRLRCAGNVNARSGYGRFLRRKILALGLADHIELLGFLSGPELARELVRSHVFCMASFVENSPNSLCEAMRVGMPCVAAYTGGVPSLVEERRTGVFFPPGDSAVLALRIEELLTDDRSAAGLGAAARSAAAERHDVDGVLAQLLGAYAAVSGAAPGAARELRA